MKFSLSAAGLVLGAALASAQGFPQAIPPAGPPREAVPDDPTLKKNVLPELPNTRNLLAPPAMARNEKQGPVGIVQFRDMSAQPKREFLPVEAPMPSPVVKSMAEAFGVDAKMFQVTPGEKVNKLAPMPSVSEFGQTKSLNRLELLPGTSVVPNRLGLNPAISR